jgi:hypothetical protein
VAFTHVGHPEGLLIRQERVDPLLLGSCTVPSKTWVHCGAVMSSDRLVMALASGIKTQATSLQTP